MNNPTKLTIVTDDAGDEAVYLDGTFHVWEPTIYACDIAVISGGNPVIIVHEGIDFSHGEWPATLNGALTQPLKIADGV